VSTVTVVLPEPLAMQLTSATREPVESAAVLVAGVARDEDRLRLLGRELHWVYEDHYMRRAHDTLLVGSGGYVPALRRAEELGGVAVWIHTHPGGDPSPSRRDRVVDEQLEPVFRVRTGQRVYASLVVAPAVYADCGAFRFTGRVIDDGQDRSVDRMWTVGTRFRAVAAFDAAAEPLPPLYDRQVRALGPMMQQHLAGLRIGLVGAGGTGSAVGEQLARLGVGQLLVVDPDKLSESNVTRVHGSGLADVGRPKAEVLAAHVAGIGLGTRVEPVIGSVVDQGVAARLRGCDVVFGCTDDNAGRVVLSRLSTYYLTPVIDCGVLVSSHEGALSGIDGRVTVLSPGYGCLLCRGRIDLRRAAAEQMPAEQRRRLAEEGYAPELEGVEPAVVAYTTLVAAMAVNELLERLVGYGVEPAPGEVLARVHDRELSTNTRSPNPGHYCADGALQRGAGDREPMLELTWSSG
jgi:molybdopterin/thiamine biosynthesis adenylyltransferase/proteasome lid subunit RPN8/RPN11